MSGGLVAFNGTHSTGARRRLLPAHSHLDDSSNPARRVGPPVCVGELGGALRGPQGHFRRNRRLLVRPHEPPRLQLRCCRARRRLPALKAFVLLPLQCMPVAVRIVACRARRLSRLRAKPASAGQQLQQRCGHATSPRGSPTRLTTSTPTRTARGPEGCRRVPRPGRRLARRKLLPPRADQRSPDQSCVGAMARGTGAARRRASPPAIAVPSSPASPRAPSTRLRRSLFSAAAAKPWFA